MMEAKCECAQTGVITICACDQNQAARCDCKGGSGLNSGSSYWEHAVSVKSTTTTPRGNHPSTTSLGSGRRYSSSDTSSESSIFSDMASWRHPSSSCFSPCTSMRRLNRTYSEHRMRCLLTTTIAFCLGISVGALLPFFFPPAELLSLHPPPSGGLTDGILNARVEVPLPTPKWVIPRVEVTSTSPPPAQLEEVERAAAPLYSSVSFVDNSINNLPQEGTSTTPSKSIPVVEGIYWSDWVERLIPPGFSDQDVAKWRGMVESSKVTTVESGCGRMQNRLVTYDTGKKACCRYRQNFDQIQGEIFSFYLSQLLGIRNLAPSTMDVIESGSNKWNTVQPDLEAAQWIDEKPVVLTQFVNNLSPAFIPELLRSSNRRVHPPDLTPIPIPESGSESEQVNSSDSRTFENISELAQWSDLIVFDYLTANLDRMVNNLYNLQWNPTMMEAPAHNLAKETSTGLLVFLDNESGLLHGYRLLDKYEHYHRLMLDSLCVFRKSTVEAIERLHAYGSIQPLFKSMLSQFSQSQLLPMLPDKSIKVLNQRIDTVHRQIQKCQSLYTKAQGVEQMINNNEVKPSFS